MTTRSRSAFLVLLPAALALASCGNGQDFLAGDVCGQGAASTNNVAAKVGNCEVADQDFAGGFVPCFDVNACESNLHACTSADRAVFSAIAACQNDYANNTDCSFEGYSEFQTCAGNAQTWPDGGNALSANCTAVFAANPGVCAIPDAGS